MKKVISLMLTLAIVLCMISTAFAASSEANEAADALNALGLFNGAGTDANGKPIYDLDRAPTRAEAVTMLVRLLGKDEEAKTGTWTTPFTDVPDWAKPYVGYAYTNKLTSGTSTANFSGDDTVTATQYLTLVLRALGYKDSEGDFSWDKAWELSDRIGITDGRYNTNSNGFLRADVALISNDALSSKIKGTDDTLLESIKTDAELPDKKEDEVSALPKRDDDETAFGDKAIKEFLLSLNPSECEFKQGGYFDNYYYVDEFIADYLYNELTNYFEYVEVKEDSGMWQGRTSGTRVACVESDVYGRNVCVATFYEGGTFYEKVFVIRPRPEA